MDKKTIQNLFSFFKLVVKLKHLPRTGWVNNKIPNCETIGSHMFSTAMLSLLFIPKDSKVDKIKCLKMALIHDLAESLVGDITPYDGISKDEKFKLEVEGFKKMVSLLPSEMSKEMMDLWMEYEKNETEEAKFVKDFDKFDMIFQAFEYEKQEKKVMESFFGYVKKNGFQTKTMETISKELLTEREIVIKKMI